MKAYNEYMDKISVSDVLHRKFVSCVQSTGPARSTAVTRRYAAVFACLAVILSGVAIMPWLLQGKEPVTPGDNLSVTQPGGPITSPGLTDESNTQPGASVMPGITDEYALILNKAGSNMTDNAYISGHFWQKLAFDELPAVFPGLAGTYNITATANFQGDGTLVNIKAHAVSAEGCTAYIRIVPGEVTSDYLIEGEVKTSDILGVTVTAGYYEGKDSAVYFASFKLSGIDYYVELTGGKAEKQELPALLDKLIGGGAADLSLFDNPVIPELREDKLTLDEARADTDFGIFLPASLPEGFTFESAVRFINQEQNYLSALWTKGMGDIHWSISYLGEDDKARITSVADTQNYDLSLYPIPYADSVPGELREIVNDPIFRSEELTLEVVRARAYEAADAGDISGYRMRFGILYGDILLKINIKGATPEEIFDILRQLKR
jgi:hypothetical protein